MRYVLYGLLGLIVAGCLHGRTDDNRRDEAFVEVDNRHFLDITLYVLRGAQRVRLGIVTGSRRQVFTLPDDLVRGGSTLRFLADPIGSNRLLLDEEITVFPGETVRLIIPPS
ncbi:hypothetical protein GQ464_011105 [Rhodocaloribacter litoris]|uniref:hypothetical protein n=1 Tax=Rhodocaloribacter litoris TaxID=2558931 RepID=UPI0014242315|nr:hypothetical protein [Rhodocaloribacter litoris]QXD14005.1 hypothetical protein GQ464_011105 [Rhodocaloribacter litoris]GIV60808.1 MAG: hypothetical protein KatS3mg043_1897 [Rhodothermaceae bacterium]